MANADRNLLFGILALQMDFITRDALVAAMNAWVLDKAKPLGRALVDRGDLSPVRRELLEPLVDEHIRRHGGDPYQSLAALSSVTPVLDALAPIAEPDLQASLTALRSGPAPRPGENLMSGAPPPGRAGTTESRFRILRPYARGGLGEVFVARDEELNREVALKQIQPVYAHDPGCRARFLLEAEVTGGLEHPGIVPVYGLGHYPDGVPYYAMRFIRGDSLKDAVDAFHSSDRARGRDPGERALEFRRLLQRFIDVCEAVAYAHSRGVLHRDLKPGNIMLGRYGETLLVDWGLAKPLGRREGPSASPVAEATLRPSSASGSAPTQHGSALGTPAFMSPEQAAGRLDDLGPASDVYGLGATLYYLLTGRAPFEGTDLDRVLGAVQRGDFPPPRQADRSVPRALEAICLKAMARHPGDRYATAQALLVDLEHWLADEPVAAYREGTAERLVRWARRHRQAVVIACVLIAVSAVAGWVGLTIRQRQVRQARERVAELRQAARADEQLGDLHVRTDRFPEAEAVFARSAQRLGGEPSLADLRARLATRADQFHRLAEFRRLADQAERFAFDAAEDDAIACSEAALGPLDVFKHDDWWDHLPVAGLGPHQVDRLRDEVYRQIILLAGVRAKEAVTSIGSAAAAPHCREGLRLIGPALRFRPDDQSARIIEVFCRIGLGEDVKRLPRTEPRSAADYYFTGVLHVWIALMPSDPITRFATRRARELSGLDFETPLATAERYLRIAAEIDPDHYWTNFWLGVALTSGKKFEAAELAFNSCTAVRPDDALAYSYRANVLGLAAAASEADRGWLALRVAADLDRAVAIEPYNAQARLAKFLAAAGLGQARQAADEALRFLACERPVHTKRGWGVLDLRNEFQLVQRVLEPLGEGHGEAPDVWGALARAHLAFEHPDEDEKALKAAERALTLRPGDPQATLVRAAVSLRRQEPLRAAEGFRAAVAALPDDYAARNGLAAALEVLGQQADALAGYEQSLRVAHRDWQKREAHQGRARTLRRLGRDADARIAEQTALDAGRAGDDH